MDSFPSFWDADSCTDPTPSRAVTQTANFKIKQNKQILDMIATHKNEAKRKKKITQTCRFAPTIRRLCMYWFNFSEYYLATDINLYTFALDCT